MRLTDAGLETVLVFDEGFELPQFAAFPLVDSEEGRAALALALRVADAVRTSPLAVPAAG